MARSPVVHFEYPSAKASGFDYLRREVKLELGSLTDQRPTEQRAVQAWVVDDFPAAFTGWNCQVTTLELQRTFWEKATILHAEHHRPQEQATPHRYARHYSDMARLLEHANAVAMLQDHALCARVVEWEKAELNLLARTPGGAEYRKVAARPDAEVIALLGALRRRAT